MEFADDVVLFSENEFKIEKMMDELNTESVKGGLKIYTKKTYLTFNTATDMETDDKRLKAVKEVKYLDKVIPNVGDAVIP